MKVRNPPKFCVEVLSQETKQFIKHEVPYDVYMYIKQLEGKIKWPDKSPLTNVYPELKCES